MTKTLLEQFRDADDVWEAALVAAFGGDAGQARYEARGRGEPGTALHAAYKARDAALRAWVAGREAV